ncbi:MAG: hypothetical protein OES32_04065 [Acidobacteriota bacterium]|nr:hypothetical protein [Acidobacteriota bacterium]MDH3522740.1 hypothetical protein [Acidobacteriota bacterium]
MPYAEWLQLGFHGLAFAMLYLAYRLMKPLVTPPANGDTPKDAALKVKLRYVLVFMVISILFFVGGVVAELYGGSQPHSIGLYISPARMPSMLSMPEVRSGEIAIEISDDGYATLAVKDRDTLRIAMDELTGTVEHFASLVGELTQRCTAAGPDAAQLSALEGGFSDGP